MILVWLVKCVTWVLVIFLKAPVRCFEWAAWEPPASRWSYHPVLEYFSCLGSWKCRRCHHAVLLKLTSWILLCIILSKSSKSKSGGLGYFSEVKPLEVDYQQISNHDRIHLSDLLRKSESLPFLFPTVLGISLLSFLPFNYCPPPRPFSLLPLLSPLPLYAGLAAFSS